MSNVIQIISILRSDWYDNMNWMIVRKKANEQITDSVKNGEKKSLAYSTRPFGDKGSSLMPLTRSQIFSSVFFFFSFCIIAGITKSIVTITVSYLPGTVARLIFILFVFAIIFLTVMENISRDEASNWLKMYVVFFYISIPFPGTEKDINRSSHVTPCDRYIFSKDEISNFRNFKLHLLLFLFLFFVCGIKLSV